MEFYRLLKKNILTHFFTKLFYLFSGKGAKPAAAPKKEPAAKPSGPRNNHYYFCIHISQCELRSAMLIIHFSIVYISWEWLEISPPHTHIIHIFYMICYFVRKFYNR